MMRIKFYEILIVFILLNLVGLQQTIAQQNKISIQINTPAKQLLYASGQIKKAALEKKYIVSQSSSINRSANEDLVIKIISDSSSSVKIASEENFKRPEHFGWQCYAVRIKKNGK